VDDHPGLPAFVGGVNVTAYVDRRFSHADTEMERVYEAIRARVVAAPDVRAESA
jgi:hypothetical protein